jgi:hypothetical protein
MILTQNNTIFLNLLNITLIFDIFVIRSLIDISTIYSPKSIYNRFTGCVSRYTIIMIDNYKSIIEYIFLLSSLIFIQSIYYLCNIIYEDINKIDGVK